MKLNKLECFKGLVASNAEACPRDSWPDINTLAYLSEALATAKISLAFLLNFCNASLNTSSAAFQTNNLQPKLPITFIKNYPLLIALLISFSFNQATILCINTHVLVLINQYSTGLFVSYRKTRLYERSFIRLAPARSR
jgi:hypothetical protein